MDVTVDDGGTVVVAVGGGAEGGGAVLPTDAVRHGASLWAGLGRILRSSVM